MEVHGSNQPQAEFWTNAGALWTALRERFDAQVHAHGAAAIDALTPEGGAFVIDVGCGAGTTTMQLADRVGDEGHVRGLDISPTMVEGARVLAGERGVTNVSFAVADAMVQPFDSDADAVYSRFGLMFFSDAHQGFANVLTALRPGGRLAFTCWQAPQANPWASRPLQVAARYVDVPFGGDPSAPGPFSLADDQRVRSVLDEAGFVDVEVESKQALAHMGANMADAVDLIFKLLPPVAALEGEDPESAATLRSELSTELSDWQTGDSVEAPSASWIVTARRPG